MKKSSGLEKPCPGDLIVAIGKPKVGDEVIAAEARGEIADLKNVDPALTEKVCS